MGRGIFKGKSVYQHLMMLSLVKSMNTYEYKCNNSICTNDLIDTVMFLASMLSIIYSFVTNI